MAAKADEALEFDPDALREKYRAERDKRLRSDGNEQYQEVTGDFTNLALPGEFAQARAFLEATEIPPEPSR